jgi:hypothetical protein
MVERLRAKPGGEAIPVTMGDFTTLEGVEGPFSLVYVVFNTFFLLLSQEDQVACFASVGRLLAPGGSFVIEAFVPDLTRFDRDQRMEVRRVEVDGVTLEMSRHDAAAQRVDSQHIRIRGDGRTEMRPVALRYAWPSELDLMARVAGFERRERWSTWTRAPFTADSGAHVSVYAR